MRGGCVHGLESVLWEQTKEIKSSRTLDKPFRNSVAICNLWLRNKEKRLHIQAVRDYLRDSSKCCRDSAQCRAGGDAAVCEKSRQRAGAKEHWARLRLLCPRRKKGVTCLAISASLRGSVVLKRLLLNKFRTSSSSGKLLPPFSIYTHTALKSRIHPHLPLAINHCRLRDPQRLRAAPGQSWNAGGWSHRASDNRNT